MGYKSYGHHKQFSPFPVLFFGLILFLLFGFKVFFIVPIIFIFMGVMMWGCGMRYMEEWDWDGMEKPKRKRKPKFDDDYADDEDVTYL